MRTVIKFIVWARIYSRFLTYHANKFAPTAFNPNYFLAMMGMIQQQEPK